MSENSNKACHERQPLPFSEGTMFKSSTGSLVVSASFIIIQLLTDPICLFYQGLAKNLYQILISHPKLCNRTPYKFISSLSTLLLIEKLKPITLTSLSYIHYFQYQLAMRSNYIDSWQRLARWAMVLPYIEILSQFMLASQPN